MPSDFDSESAGFWMSSELLADEIEELRESQALLKHLIKDSVPVNENWEAEGLLMLLFEYYSSVTHQLKIYYDVLLKKPRVNEETGEESYLVSTSDISMLISLSNLARVNSLNLTYDHRISLKIH